MKVFKNILIIALAIALGYFILIPKKKEKIEVPYPVKEYVELEVERVVKLIDEEGFEHAVTKEVDNVVKHYEQLSDSAKNKLDSVTRLLNISRKQLSEWRSYAVTLEDSLMKAEKIGDTFVYNDKYSTIKFFPDSQTFSLKYNATINHAEYYKRNWFLGPKKHYIDFWIEDPRATINNVKRIRFEPKKPFIGLEIDAVGRVGHDVEFGSEALMRIGNGKLGAGYTYGLNNSEWKPVFVGKYNLISY